MAICLIRFCLLWLPILLAVFALPRSEGEASSIAAADDRDSEHRIGQVNNNMPGREDDNPTVSSPGIWNNEDNDGSSSSNNSENGKTETVGIGPEFTTTVVETGSEDKPTISELIEEHEPTVTSSLISEPTSTVSESIGHLDQLEYETTNFSPGPESTESSKPETTNFSPGPESTESSKPETTEAVSKQMPPSPSILPPPTDVGNIVAGNFSLGVKFQIGGPPHPKTKKQKEALKVLNFFANMQYELFRWPCSQFTDLNYEQLGFLENYKRDVICLIATQSKAQAYQIEKAMKAGGVKPMPVCGRDAFEFPYMNALDLVRLGSWFTGLGVSLYLGAVQTFAGNPELATLAASMATDESRKSVILYVDQKNNHANPFQVPFDTPIDHNMAYQMLLTKLAPRCRADIKVEMLPVLWTDTDFSMPPNPPGKHPPTVYQFYWDMSTMKAPSPDERMLYMAWLSESTNVTLTEIRRCGTDPATKVGCGRTNLGKGLRGTAIAVVVDSGDVGNGWTQEEFLSHAITRPVRVIIS